MPSAGKILLPSQAAKDAIPVIPVAKSDWSVFHKRLQPAERQWVDSTGFTADNGRHIIVPGPDGLASKVLYGLGNGKKPQDPFEFGKLARGLHAGTYNIKGDLPAAHLAALGWLLEAYDFDRYKKSSPVKARLVCPSGADRASLIRAAESVYLVRDLVNTPASDMGPAELETAARQLARSHRAKLTVVSGQKLAREFPMVYAVGKASPRVPRLIDFSWGPVRAPKLTLVGKGVCFDTGGLDIKPSSGMLTMKKDMGGAATVLGLAQLIMTAKLPVRLRVLIPAVENAIAGEAFRPGDILKSRKGLSVEIGNTDAEGRLVLADALALADQEEPDLMIDMATLTGAARVALGPDVVPFYTRSDELAAALQEHGRAQNDPVWRMPLWDPYLSWMDSKVADINNASESSFAGSVTAALFLHRFVEKARNYIHFDIFAWTPSAKPGRPKGGEAQAMRALFALLEERYRK
jgi:leucyl aminopeptidase